MTQSVDVLSLLPFFTWRGERYPIRKRQVRFAHEGARHQLQYRDGQLVEQTGAENERFVYTLAMREGVVKGGYSKLFTQGLAKLKKDIKDRTPGELVDPIYGPRRCVPLSFGEDLDVALRDGVDVDVEFEEAPEIDDVTQDPTALSIQGLRDEAGKLDEEIQRVEWVQEESPQPSQDILSAITGVGDQVAARRGQAVAALEDYASKMDRLDQTIEREQNPDLWPLRNAARKNREAAVKLKARANEPPGKRIVQTVNAYNRGIQAVAAEAGMTVDEFIALNPILSRLPYVPAGTVIRKLSA